LDLARPLGWKAWWLSPALSKSKICVSHCSHAREMAAWSSSSDWCARRSSTKACCGAVSRRTVAKSCGHSCCIGRHTSAHEPTHAARAMRTWLVRPMPASFTGSRACRSARSRSAGVASAVPTMSWKARVISASCTAAASVVASTPIVRRK
jgi:hypothetical protein